MLATCIDQKSVTQPKLLAQNLFQKILIMSLFQYSCFFHNPHKFWGHFSFISRILEEFFKHRHLYLMCLQAVYLKVEADLTLDQNSPFLFPKLWMNSSNQCKILCVSDLLKVCSFQSALLLNLNFFHHL